MWFGDAACCACAHLHHRSHCHIHHRSDAAAHHHFRSGPGVADGVVAVVVDASAGCWPEAVRSAVLRLLRSLRPCSSCGDASGGGMSGRAGLVWTLADPFAVGPEAVLPEAESVLRSCLCFLLLNPRYALRAPAGKRGLRTHEDRGLGRLLRGLVRDSALKQSVSRLKVQVLLSGTQFPCVARTSNLPALERVSACVTSIRRKVLEFGEPVSYTRAPGCSRSIGKTYSTLRKAEWQAHPCTLQTSPVVDSAATSSGPRIQWPSLASQKRSLSDEAPDLPKPVYR